MGHPQVVCLGETMAQLAPLGGQGVEVAETFQVRAAGAESNVALGLCQLGHQVAWAGRIGDDALGRRLLAQLAVAGVGIGLVTVDPARPTGLFVKSPGAGGSAVTYYRDGSAGSAIDLADVRRSLALLPEVLHLSGITPALSASCLRASRFAVSSTRAAGARVSFDVNYRPVLWKDRHVAARVLLELANASDVVFVGLDEARELWPQVADAADVRTLMPDVPHLVVKDASFQATEFTTSGATASPAERVPVVEPVGAGDAFAAGWLHGYLGGEDPEVRLRLGHLMARRALASVSDYDTSPVRLDLLHAEAAQGLGGEPMPGRGAG